MQGRMTDEENLLIFLTTHNIASRRTAVGSFRSQSGSAICCMSGASAAQDTLCLRWKDRTHEMHTILSSLNLFK